MEKLQVKIGGMSCSFCVSTIEKGVGRIDGVLDVNVNLTHEETLVAFDPAKAKPSEIKKTISDLGYTVRDPDKVRGFEEQEAELRTERNSLILVSAIASVAMTFMVLMWLELLPMGRAWPFTLWLMPTLALSTVFGPGWHFLNVAWASLRRRIFNQHVLLEFGAFAGLIGGFLGYVSPAFPAPDFFGVTVFITTYHILASYVSLLIRTRSSQAVSKLLELVPATARVVRDGQEEEIPIEKVHVGDLVRIRPGESVSVDGEIVEGTSGIDMSLVSGESIPVAVIKGDQVIGGAINQEGSLLVSVTRVGSESFLQQVARQIEESRALKPTILALVDRVLLVFVPTVLAFAGGAILIWTLGAWVVLGSADWTRAVFAALAVLVMGYPCAMGMATPLAMIRGGGMAARKGILMRSAEAFQVLKEVRKVVLDKTGTITRGKPAVVDVFPLAGHQENEVLQLAAGIESASEHPLARAVVHAAKERNLTVPQVREFRAQPGKGVTASVDGHKVAVGSPLFIEEAGIDLNPVRSKITSLQAAGNTVVVLAIDGMEGALLAIADPIKPDAQEAIARMRDAGLEPVMLTG
ncbi:MAG: cation-translocating P-type ATPase, partial [SAR324 cluster bacterium]|nr:cation-translocating P-type ATPase [SAR324 cluster bacterium]